MSKLFFVVLIVVGLASAGVAAERAALSGAFGVGLTYGQIGANVEYRVTEQVSADAGFGLNGKYAWFAGGYFYLKPESKGVRTRLLTGVGTVYGRNGAGRWVGYDKFVLGIGVSWANRDKDYHGPEVDVTTSGDLSLGWRF